jgi:hypothetical protein
MEMQAVLDLQKLEVPEPDTVFGSSCTSSTNDCCKGRAQAGGE